MVTTSNLMNIKLCSPRSINEALNFLSSPRHRPIAGGTDIIPGIRSGRLSVDALVDISFLDELRFIELFENKIQIGANTTFTELIESDLLEKTCKIIIETAKNVGAEQTRNRGTIGGNLGNASPAADLITTLLTLDANVVLISLKGKRSLPLERFLLGPGKTGIEPGELIHHIYFDTLRDNSKAIYLKVGKRRGMACALANLSLIISGNKEGHINKSYKVAIGAVAPTAIRCYKTEQILRTEASNEELINKSIKAICSECNPIDDIRATANYRKYVVGKLLKHALEKLWSSN